MGAEFGQHGCRKRHGARLAALGQLEAKSGLGLLKAFHHGKLTGGEIDVAPAERADLATPQTAEDGEQGRHKHRRAADSLDQLHGLWNVVGLHRLVVRPSADQRLRPDCGSAIPSGRLVRAPA